MANKYDLITMGRATIDLYAQDIGVPFEKIKSFAAYVGGSPTNIAVGARRLGLNVALISGVGEDPVGDFVLAFLSEEEIETAFITRKPMTRTGAVLLGIERPDKIPLVSYRDNAADIQLTIDDVKAAPIAECRAFEFAGTNLSQEPSRSATLYAVELAKSSGVLVIMDLDLRADQWRDVRVFGLMVRSVLPNVDIAIGTEEEIKAAVLESADQLTITHSQITAPEIRGDLNTALLSLLERGLEALVVKQGSKGSSVYLQGGEVVFAPGFSVEVFNVLGAGDAFAGGMIYGRLKGWDWYRAARMGNACGAIVVTRHGCANFMPYENEALEFIEERGGF
ncbi:MAG: 5-dehydro-2-deoxygluconokinase [Chloroflexi bacterium]|nr:5-dehydro-2-deoxygluconokinase [Chloroflexota bacterium]